MTTVTCALGQGGPPTEHLAQDQAHRCAQETHSDTFEMCLHLAGGLGSRLLLLASPCSPERTAAPCPHCLQITTPCIQRADFLTWTCCQWFPRTCATLPCFYLVMPRLGSPHHIHHTHTPITHTHTTPITHTLHTHSSLTLTHTPCLHLPQLWAPRCQDDLANRRV